MQKRKPAANWPPPKTPPMCLYNKFTQNGEMPLKCVLYFAQKYSGFNAKMNQWKNLLIDRLIFRHIKMKKIGGYSLREEIL